MLSTIIGLFPCFLIIPMKYNQLYEIFVEIYIKYKMLK